jgi:hypothetical protein
MGAWGAEASKWIDVFATASSTKHHGWHLRSQPQLNSAAQQPMGPDPDGVPDVERTTHRNPRTMNV